MIKFILLLFNSVHFTSYGFTLRLNLHLVIQLFVFQIIVGSCSALIKEESDNPKVAENLTVYLPDFSSGAIKSLLCLMYTGKESITTSYGLICLFLIFDEFTSLFISVLDFQGQVAMSVALENLSNYCQH